jgi:predicted RecB family nuclease
MFKADGAIRLSASDLVGHLNCPHLTELDLAVSNGKLSKPKIWNPLVEILAERGALHEQAFIEQLEASGHPVTVIDGIGVDAVSVSRTSEAMKAGAEIIAQGALEADGWIGRADILRRIETPSQLGPWSYEIIDTKLARETKGGTVLQLCLYSDPLSSFQGLSPEFAYVVVPSPGYQAQAFRMLDYAAYYRRVRTSLEKSVALGMNGPTYPDPKDHCEICRWAGRCDARRRKDDHLCLVANIAKSLAFNCFAGTNHWPNSLSRSC